MRLHDYIRYQKRSENTQNKQTLYVCLYWNENRPFKKKNKIVRLDATDSSEIMRLCSLNAGPGIDQSLNWFAHKSIDQPCYRRVLALFINMIYLVTSHVFDLHYM